MSGGPRAGAGADPGVARTSGLDGAIDLVEVAGDDGVLFVRDGEGLAGRGTALRIDVAAADRPHLAEIVAGALAGLRGEGEPGTGPVALTSLPFDVDAPATLVVPQTIVGRRADGTGWVTTVGGDGPDLEVAVGERARPGRFEVRSVESAEAWMATVASARDQLRAGRGRKVVLARSVQVEADVPLRQRDLLRRLQRSYGSCLLFAIDGHVGASPELLVARTGDVVRANPMAGTRPRLGDPEADARLAAGLLASAKDREEHQITIDAVLDALLDHCSYVDAAPEPSVVAVANVQHLASAVEGRLSLPPASVLELVAALHPTPAVGGDPRDVALEMIAEHEAGPRGRYAGPVGWVDADGNGEFAVGIRGALLDGTVARLWAGVGVLADSDPASELEETEAKLAAMLTAIVRP